MATTRKLLANQRNFAINELAVRAHGLLEDAQSLLNAFRNHVLPEAHAQRAGYLREARAKVRAADRVLKDALKAECDADETNTKRLTPLSKRRAKKSICECGEVYPCTTVQNRGMYSPLEMTRHGVRK